jgi:peptidoglycan/xylan/chitin deacetylase (PgdA/CDA1 family)
MNNYTFCLKIDADTERGTKIGIPHLLYMLKELAVPATFLFSLGPDNTGRAVKRVFHRGFLRKARRTSIIQTYGIKTLLNGVFIPGPHIGHKHQEILRQVAAQGFEVGIHSYDHQKWQNSVAQMTMEQIKDEFNAAYDEFKRIFGYTAKTAGAPGWQANLKTLAIYDQFNLTYASDSRGKTPFFPRVLDTTFKTLQLPTTLPTLDELLGLPEFPVNKLTEYYISLLQNDHPNIMTLHAEIEGMKYKDWFYSFLTVLKQKNVIFKPLLSIAEECLKNREQISVCELVNAEVPGRGGFVAMQKNQ